MQLFRNSLHNLLRNPFSAPNIAIPAPNIARPFPATVANTFSAIPCSNIPVQKWSQHATIQPLKRHSQMSKYSINANKTNNRCDAKRNLHVFGKHRRSKKQCGQTSQGRSQALPNHFACLSSTGLIIYRAGGWKLQARQTGWDTRKKDPRKKRGIMSNQQAGGKKAKHKTSNQQPIKRNKNLTFSNIAATRARCLPDTQPESQMVPQGIW